MVRQVPAFLIGVFAISGLAPSAHAQAAAAYGMAAGHSATVTTGVANKLSNALNKTNDQTAAKLANVRQSAMADNRRQLETKAGGAPASIHIESTPDKATILVDGAAVANTPADLKLLAGKHQIEIARAGFVNWKKEVTVARGDNPSLKATLDSQYKSELKLSIHQ
jgi:PEGA domain-containing protein